MHLTTLTVPEYSIQFAYGTSCSMGETDTFSTMPRVYAQQPLGTVTIMSCREEESCIQKGEAAQPRPPRFQTKELGFMPTSAQPSTQPLPPTASHL